MIKLTINNKPVSLDADPEMPLLWALRDFLKLILPTNPRHIVKRPVVPQMPLG